MLLWKKHAINLSSAVRLRKRVFLMIFSKCPPRPFLRHLRHHLFSLVSLLDTDEADTESTNVLKQGEETPK
ncbi:hypothetical protein CDL12_30112 [Handroanthus impetiginosus]|uniref:Uncharacterized protein n=1 Tax=Handroanthus impetiginosus TaxID=429701 RepID=A0A2G9FWI7_9LAMI|nr:hypothetical protein CDL12_30112 [Handroanthus impetiginosus]